MHPLPAVPRTVCFGQTRKVDQQSTISIGSAIYSLPSCLVEKRVWARAHGTEIMIVHVDSPGGPREVARHALTPPGRPSIKDEHYPPRPAGALEAHAAGTVARGGRVPGAWARRGGVVDRRGGGGSNTVRRKMAEAVDLSKLHGTEQGRACARGVRAGGPVRRWGPGRDPRASPVRDGDPVPRKGLGGVLVAALDSWLGGVRTMSGFEQHRGIVVRLNGAQARWRHANDRLRSAPDAFGTARDGSQIAVLGEIHWQTGCKHRASRWSSGCSTEQAGRHSDPLDLPFLVGPDRREVQRGEAEVDEAGQPFGDQLRRA